MSNEEVKPAADAAAPTKPAKKGCFVCKLIKGLGITLVLLIVLVVAAVATLPFWCRPILRSGANYAVPKLTKTDFSIGHISINPYTGRLELGEVYLGNPTNYSEKCAVSVSNLVVDVAMSTVMSNVVHVTEIALDGAFVSYVSADGVNNFDQIQYNVAGSKEKFEENKAKSEAKKAEKEAKKAAKEEKRLADRKAELDAMSKEERELKEALYEAEDALEELNKKRFAIDYIRISGLKVKYGILTIPLPKIELRDLGKNTNGVTAADVGSAVLSAVLNTMKSIGGAIGDGVKAVGGAIGSGAKAVGSGAKAVGGAIGSGAKAVGGAIGSGAGKAVDAVKGIFGGSSESSEEVKQEQKPENSESK